VTNVKCEAIVRGVRVEPTPKQLLPMVKLSWTVDGDVNPVNGIHTGTAVEDVFVFYEKNNNRTKRRLHALCAATGVELDLIPKKLEAITDFDPFVGALKGKRALLTIEQVDGRGARVTRYAHASPKTSPSDPISPPPRRRGREGRTAP
jgi:hypothetical protein